MREFIQACAIALCLFKYQHIAYKWDVPGATQLYLRGSAINCSPAVLCEMYLS